MIRCLVALKLALSLKHTFIRRRQYAPLFRTTIFLEMSSSIANEENFHETGALTPQGSSTML